ncbi:MAG: SUMF1/EgtB/PvdO family nonheme iron enzyme, partial [Chitinivibrionales bacterium]
LKYILIMLVEGRAEETIGLESHLVPFLAPLRELRDSDKEDFVKFMMRQCNLHDFDITHDDFIGLLQSKRAIILLDGLDEVADAATRIKTCHWIDKARSRFNDTRFIVTSRYAGYFGESRLEGNLLELGIQDFRPQEIEQFLNYWFENIELQLHPEEDEAYWRKEALREAADLLDNIEKNRNVQGLATNPLMLQIIACIRKDRGTILPERRVELYKECVDVFLERWDLAKEIPVAFRGLEARAILQPIALWLHENEGRRSAPIDQIIEVIKKPLEKMNKTNVDPRTLLLSIRDRSGIFMGYNETEYGFTHLSFQEYFAAEEIRNRVMQDQRAIDILIKNYGNRWWREVTLLSLALDNPSILDQFVAKIIFQPAFESEPSIVSDAILEAVSKPFDMLFKAHRDKELSNKAASNIIDILLKHGKVSVVNFVKLKKSKKKKKPERITSDKDNSEMTLVPAGTFLYGSREDDKEAQSNEKPQQSIYLPDYYMDVNLVTNAQYCGFLNKIKLVKGNEWKINNWIEIGGNSVAKQKNYIVFENNRFTVEKGFEELPITVVTWFGAGAYCIWSDKRLPSEIEWEKAARGTDGRKYPWGDEFKENVCNYGTKYSGTTEVGQFDKGKSPYVCFDMAGNVWEWCEDRYHNSNQRDSTYLLSGLGEEKLRVLRGGSWHDYPLGLRCAGRTWRAPETRSYNIGFRCVRDLDSQDKGKKTVRKVLS